MSAEILYFNTTSAMCQNVTADFRPAAEKIVVNSVFTRYSEKEVGRGGRGRAETRGKALRRNENRGRSVIF